jgi:hypothetical protein
LELHWDLGLGHWSIEFDSSFGFAHPLAAPISCRGNPEEEPMVTQMMQDNKEKPDPDNLALVRKHLNEYLSATGQSEMLKQH